MASEQGLAADRGFYVRRWSIFTVLACGFILVFFHRIAPGVVSSDLTAAFGVTGAALGSLAASYYYVYTAMQIPAGVLADTVGARISVTVGNTVAGAGSILFALAPDFTTASAGRLLVGLGVSVVFVGLMKSNTVWFSDRRYGFVSGLTLLLGNLGAIAATGPLAVVLERTEWRTVFVALGIFSLVLAAISWALVRNKPEDVGYRSVREMEGLSAPARRSQHWILDLRSVVRLKRLWAPFWLDFGLAGSFFAFIGLWAVPLLRDLHGLDRAGAADYTTISLVAFAAATLAAGSLSDWMGRRKPVLVAGCAGYLASILALILLPWEPGASAAALFVLMGIAAGAFVVAYAQGKEVAPPQVSGMAIALVNTGLFLGAAVLQTGFGWAMDLVAPDGAYGAAAYHAGLWLLVFFAAVSLGAALLLKETGCRNIASAAD